MLSNVEKSQGIGFVILVLLLVFYVFYMSPADPEPSAEAPQDETNQKHAANKDTASSLTSGPDKKALGTNNPEKQRTDSLPSLFASSDSQADSQVDNQVDDQDSFYRVETQDLDLYFSSHGGELCRVRLKNYLTHDKKPLWLIDSLQSQWHNYLLYQGQDIPLRSLSFTPLDFSKGLTKQVAAGDTLALSFVCVLGDGSQLRRTYHIPHSGYLITHHFHSQVDGIQGFNFRLTQKMRWVEQDRESQRLLTALNYYLAADNGGNQGEWIELEANAEAQQASHESAKMDWIALKSKFFLIGVFPLPQGAEKGYCKDVQLKAKDLGASGPFLKALDVGLFLPESQEGGYGYQLYVGPNDHVITSAVSGTFSENLYLGWGILSWINEKLLIPLFGWLLSSVGNYGLVIVLLVFAVRMVLFPLTYRSYLGMAKMKMLKPEIDQIKKDYPEDKTKQQTETMSLYQRAGINPLSGCIPMLLQMPVLLSMFYFFPNMIAFRQAGLWWAHDLSSYDSVLSLPFHIPVYGSHVSLFNLFMAITTLLFIKYNNQTANITPQMKVIQYIMPILPLLYLNSYSAALTFYYSVANVVSIGQQLLIKSLVDETKIHESLQANKRKNAGKKSSFQQRLEETLKQRQQSGQKKKTKN